MGESHLYNFSAVSTPTTPNPPPLRRLLRLLRLRWVLRLLRLAPPFDALLSLGGFLEAAFLDDFLGAATGRVAAFGAPVGDLKD